MVENIILGIDFGSTTSSIAIYKSGKSEIVPNRRLTSTIPSVVALKNRGYDTIVGHGASDQGITDHQFIITDIKSLLGRKYNDIHITDIKKKLHFNLHGDSSNKIRIVVSDFEDFLKDLAIEQVASYIFSELKLMAENFLKSEKSKKKIIGVVLTVPANFSKDQRQAMFDAATIAGLNVLHTISELTSVVYAYGLSNKYDKPARVLIYDLSKDKLEVNLALVISNKLYIEYTHNEPNFGVFSFIDVLVDYCIEGLPSVASRDPYAMARLRNACEKAMETLSFKEFTSVDIDHLSDNLNFETILTREEFEDLASHLFERALDPIKHVLKTSKLEKSALNEVILVGGGCFIPKIKSNLNDFFGEVNINNDINPDEVVALGAARFGGISMFKNFTKDIVSNKPPKVICSTGHQLLTTTSKCSIKEDKAMKVVRSICKSNNSKKNSICAKVLSDIIRSQRPLIFTKDSKKNEGEDLTQEGLKGRKKKDYPKEYSSAPLGFKINPPPSMVSNEIKVAESSNVSSNYDEGNELFSKIYSTKYKYKDGTSQNPRKTPDAQCKNNNSESYGSEENFTVLGQSSPYEEIKNSGENKMKTIDKKGSCDSLKDEKQESYGLKEIFTVATVNTPTEKAQLAPRSLTDPILTKITRDPCKKTKIENCVATEVSTAPIRDIPSGIGQSISEKSISTTSVQGSNQTSTNISTGSCGMAELCKEKPHDNLAQKFNLNTKNTPKEDTPHNIDKDFNENQYNYVTQNGFTSEKEPDLVSKNLGVEINDKDILLSEKYSKDAKKVEDDKELKCTKLTGPSDSTVETVKMYPAKNSQEHSNITFYEGKNQNNYFGNGNLLSNSIMGWTMIPQTTDIAYTLGFFKDCNMFDTETKSSLNNANEFQRTYENESGIDLLKNDGEVNANSLTVSSSPTKTNLDSMFIDKYYEDKTKKYSNPENLDTRGSTANEEVKEYRKINDGNKLSDLTMFDIGICVSTGAMHTIIPCNSLLPFTGKLVFSILIDNQRDFFIQLYAGQRYMAEDNLMLSSFKVDGITQGKKGSYMYEITLIFNTLNNMDIIIDEIGSKTLLEKTLSPRGHGFNSSAIESMLINKPEIENVDNLYRSELEMRQRLENLAYKINCSAKKLSSIEEPDRKIIELASKNLRFLYTSDLKNKTKYRKRFKELQSLVLSAPAMREINAELIPEKAEYISVKPTSEEISRLIN